jgi:hypothetical protein
MSRTRWVVMVLAGAVAASGPVSADGWETGPNVSGESSASERRELIKNPAPTARAYDPMRIDVPRGPDGLPQRPVRGLSRTEEMEMDDLEYRYQMGLIGEAEYFSRRNAIMQRIGLEPEY